MLQRDELIRKIEKRAKSDKRRGVDLTAVYASRPPIPAIFPVGTMFVYKGHVGKVQGLDCSAFTKKVFATGGSDGEVHIYNILSKEPVQVIEAKGEVNAVKWSKVRRVARSEASRKGEGIYIVRNGGGVRGSDAT